MADVVMSVRNGEQIARKYQPVVHNPNTQAQVEARAKLKLMSQLSAVMAPVIAMRRVGSVSSRNMFVKTNYRNTGFSDGKANITLTDVKLTHSIVGFPDIKAVRSGSSVTASFVGHPDVDVSRVVYAMFLKGADDTLRYVTSAVATEASGNYDWPVSMQLPDTDSVVVIYAYGVRDNTDAARALFGDLTAKPAEQVASLVVTRTLTEVDITLTETKAVESAPANAQISPRDEEDENRNAKKK